MKNVIDINQVIRNIIIIVFLLCVFFNSFELIKFILIPFIICVVLSLIKYICLILGKDKYVSIFNKLYATIFLFFAFCFMIFWSYTIIKNNNYITLLTTIPFWLIWLHFIRKFFLKKKEKPLQKKKTSQSFSERTTIIILVSAVLLSGVLCLFFGIKNTYTLNKKTKSYINTDGYFKDYSIYDVDEDKTTYRLTYEYEVDGKKYTVATDYGVGHIPSLNSKRTVKYDPNKHENAVLTGTTGNKMLIYLGTFFTLGGIAFILFFLQVKGVFDKVKIDVTGTFLGIMFTAVGIGILLLENETTNSMIETIKTLGLRILIPIILLIAGISLTLKSAFSNSKK